VAVTRGDIVVVATKGAYTGKPRPAVLVQSDLFNATHASVTICPVTSDCIDAPLFRLPIPPGARTGLQAPSQIMIDKVVSVPRASIARVIGECDSAELQDVDDALRRWLGLE
jgi:mRNA interferase MazF